MTQAGIQLPKYKSHKEVGALMIAGISLDGVLSFIEEGYAPIQMPKEWLDKHNPEVGGYLVFYKDGYKSYSPRQAFDEGYTRITNDQKEKAKKIYQMNLHDKVVLKDTENNIDLVVFRVPGGWVYATLTQDQYSKKNIASSGVFVPFDGEYNK